MYTFTAVYTCTYILKTKIPYFSPCTSTQFSYLTRPCTQFWYMNMFLLKCAHIHTRASADSQTLHRSPSAHRHSQGRPKCILTGCYLCYLCCCSATAPRTTILARNCQIRLFFFSNSTIITIYSRLWNPMLLCDATFRFPLLFSPFFLPALSSPPPFLSLCLPFSSLLLFPFSPCAWRSMIICLYNDYNEFFFFISCDEGCHRCPHAPGSFRNRRLSWWQHLMMSPYVYLLYLLTMSYSLFYHSFGVVNIARRLFLYAAQVLLLSVYPLIWSVINA